MDFGLTEEQNNLKRAVIAFAQKELNEQVLDRDRDQIFSNDNWRKCAQFGIQGLPIPEALGGSGADILTAMVVMEGLGYACEDQGLIFALNAQMWSVQLPIMVFGTPEQKSKYLPGLCSGEMIGAHGMTEPDSGSDAYSLRTRADKRDGGYLLNGTKTLVTNAPVADVTVVFATVDKDKGIAGVTAFLVDRDTPGFATGSDMHKMGLRTATMSEVVLQDCFVPESSRLGREGGGSGVFQSSMAWERGCILASHVGAMERQLDKCVRYARERKQFGKRIGQFQSVSNRLANMKVRLETSRLVLYKMGWLKQQGKSADLEAALAKLYLSESYVQSSLDAIRIFGGYGYMTEFGVEKDLRDAVGGTLYSGTSDIQKTIIARLLGV